MMDGPRVSPAALWLTNSCANSSGLPQHRVSSSFSLELALLISAGGSALSLGVPNSQQGEAAMAQPVRVMLLIHPQWFLRLEGILSEGLNLLVLKCSSFTASSPLCFWFWAKPTNWNEGMKIGEVVAGNSRNQSNGGSPGEVKVVPCRHYLLPPRQSSSLALITGTAQCPTPGCCIYTSKRFAFILEDTVLISSALGSWLELFPK